MKRLKLASKAIEAEPGLRGVRLASETELLGSKGSKGSKVKNSFFPLTSKNVLFCCKVLIYGMQGQIF